MRPAVIHAVGLITRALWVRFHMALILFAMALAGIATTSLLLRLGLHSMHTCGFAVAAGGPVAIRLLA